MQKRELPKFLREHMVQYDSTNPSEVSQLLDYLESKGFRIGRKSVGSIYDLRKNEMTGILVLPETERLIVWEDTRLEKEIDTYFQDN
ncbi:hypothetical protein HOC80_04755 [archaeon]|nr:hypothetical protein [archaeon]MBT4417384.1 hypothetical protein [archaeon]